ncbi:hypothetical protein F6P96_16645 [Escherichia coli]|nr:hypothetical protein F6P96_16645 [Escherichia coli]
MAANCIKIFSYPRIVQDRLARARREKQLNMTKAILHNRFGIRLSITMEKFKTAWKERTESIGMFQFRSVDIGKVMLPSEALFNRLPFQLTSTERHASQRIGGS